MFILILTYFIYSDGIHRLKKKNEAKNPKPKILK